MCANIESQTDDGEGAVRSSEVTAAMYQYHRTPLTPCTDSDRRHPTLDTAAETARTKQNKQNAAVGFGRSFGPVRDLGGARRQGESGGAPSQTMLVDARGTRLGPSVPALRALPLQD